MEGFTVEVHYDEEKFEWIARIVGDNTFTSFGDTASEALMDLASQYCLYCEEQEIEQYPDEE